MAHLHDEMARNPARVHVNTAYGPVIGGRAANDAVIFLEIPYALPPGRFEDPVALPTDYRYEVKEYIQESKYATQPQPRVDGQAQGNVWSAFWEHVLKLFHGGIPIEVEVGLGKPSENPLFLNIAIPPSFPMNKKFPVKVYIHGGFLQFGSPHSLSSQAQFIAADRSEIWVNVGYRLSAFGFLASDKPRLDGNYGFKDQWMALEWIKANIEAFGGDPEDIQLTGLSAGAHSVHQLLHYASQLPNGKKAPFHSAIMQSNAILTDAKTPSELQPQFDALCRALNLDPSAPDILSILKDSAKVPWESITKVIETDVLGPYGTFRGCLADDWTSVKPGPMNWQSSGELGRGLLAHGVKCVVIGDLTEEWFIYSMSHPIKGPQDILPNLERYFPTDVSINLIKEFSPLAKNAERWEAVKLYGEIMSCAQIHLPVRWFAKDMAACGFPVLRYEIRWTPEQCRPAGYVSHGCDRVLWALRIPSLEQDQVEVAKGWLDRVAQEVNTLMNGEESPRLDVRDMITLKEDRSISWTKDEKWDSLMKIKI